MFKPKTFTRRQFSQLLGMGVTSAMLGGCGASVSQQRESETTQGQWMGADEIKAATRVAVFPHNPVAGLSLSDVEVLQAKDLGIIENVRDLQLHEVTVNGARLSADELLQV